MHAIHVSDVRDQLAKLAAIRWLERAWDEQFLQGESGHLRPQVGRNATSSKPGPSPQNPEARYSSGRASTCCLPSPGQGSPAACHYCGSHQPAAPYSLNKWNSYCLDPLLPLRSPSVCEHLNSLPVSMLGLGLQASSLSGMEKQAVCFSVASFTTMTMNVHSTP